MKSVVMIGCGVQEVEAVKIARQAGFHVIVTDRNPDAPGFAYADESVVVDGKDAESIIAYVMMNRERLNIRGVFTLVNLTTTASIVAGACGLPGIPVSAAVAGQNKLLMKRLMQANNIPTPEFYEASTIEDAREAFIKLGQVAFVKSVNSFGGQGCQKVEDESQLTQAFAYALNNSSYKKVIVEKFVAGTFHDVNGLYYDDKFYPIGIVDSYFLTEYPPGTPISPIEHMVHCPSQLPRERLGELYALLERCTRALGINFGPVGGDAILTNDGPMLLEVAPRLHGASGTLWMVPFSTGTRPVQAVIEVLAGEPLNVDLITPKYHRVCMNKFILPTPGKVTEICGASDAEQLPGMLKIYMFKNVGDEIVSYRNSTDIACSLIAMGDSLEEVQDTIARAESVIRIQTQ